MKIAISSTGTSLKDEVDPRFGRAAYLCIYDTSAKKVIEVVDNTEGVNASQGAGINAAGLIASKGVEAILTGRVGPKAMAVIEKANIEVVSGTSGLVEDAIAGFMAGNITDNSGSPDKVSTQPAGCRQAGGQGQGQGRGGGQGRGCGGGGRGLGQGQGQGRG